MAGIEDKTRACQVRLVAYGTHFLSHMMINQLRYGIPGINYVALAMTVKAFGQFMSLNYSDLRELEKRTGVLVSHNIQMEKEVFATGKGLVSHQHGMGYLAEIEQTGHSFDGMTDVFEENQ